MKFRLTKSSQYKKETVLWQISPIEKDSGYPDKFYLLISFHKEKGQYIRFVRERPSLTWESSGAFASLVRKHMNSAVLSEIYADSEGKNIWIPLFSSSQCWYLHLHHEGAVELSLLSPDKVSLVRLGAKGIFTKKKEAEEIPSLETLKDITEEFLKDLKISDEPKITKEKNTSENESSDSISHFQREVRRRLSRRLKTVSSASEKLKKSVHSEEDIALLEKQARLLQSYLYKVQANQNSLRLSKEETGEDECVIPLKEHWSAADNVSNYFERLKKLKKGKNALAEQLSKTEKELKDLEFENSRLQTTPLSETELLTLLKRFRLPLEKPDGSKVDTSTQAYKVYKSDGMKVLVGKGPKENDELTKAARSNDYWVHAIGMGGSHVIIPFQQLPKTGLSQKLRREASILALHFSKIRKDLAGEVYITQRRYLTKKKGMPPGLWLVQQSDNMYVSYTEDELKAILSSGG